MPDKMAVFAAVLSGFFVRGSCRALRIGGLHETAVYQANWHGRVHRLHADVRATLNRSLPARPAGDGRGLLGLGVSRQPHAGRVLSRLRRGHHPIRPLSRQVRPQEGPADRRRLLHGGLARLCVLAVHLRPDWLAPAAGARRRRHHHGIDGAHQGLLPRRPDEEDPGGHAGIVRHRTDLCAAPRRLPADVHGLARRVPGPDCPRHPDDGHLVLPDGDAARGDALHGQHLLVVPALLHVLPAARLHGHPRDVLAAGCTLHGVPLGLVLRLH